MRLHVEPGSTSIGNVKIHQISRVIELDAGHIEEKISKPSTGNVRFSRESLLAIEARLAIIIPCMNEEQNILDGVLHGVPHDSLIIIVSNSDEAKFQAECELFADFCKNTERSGIIVHQHDGAIAHAFREAGMSELIHEGSAPLRVRNGKGEAMMIGVVLAKIAGEQFVGFIDADNLVAGSVHEYCKVYAAGLHHALHNASNWESTSKPKHAMVRIKWNSKPKVRDGEIVFEPSGRSSIVVNKWMNRLLRAITPTATDTLIQTGNAGEHAMSLDLAMTLRFATGYAVEPFQLIDVCERLDDVQIFQVETRNPHFHDISKGDEHIERMQVQGLSTIYHSSLTPPELKEELKGYLANEFPKALGADGAPAQAKTYPPMHTMNLKAFGAALETRRGTLRVHGPCIDEKDN
jgi:mannosyl-3-phosphoglycerate synthase